MGISVNFSSSAVETQLNKKLKVTSIKLENAMEKAAKEMYTVVRELAPYKSGTLQRSVRRKREGGAWVVSINANQKVPGKERRVSDYLAKIESGDFQSIGKRSREKEGYINKRRMAALRVERSPQGTYVGGIFFGRAEKAVVPKWEKRFAKIFKEAMARGVQNRTAGGQFTSGFTT